MHKLLVIRLYSPLDTLHVLDFISCTSHLAYTKCDVQLIKVAPDDGLI